MHYSLNVKHITIFEYILIMSKYTKSILCCTGVRVITQPPLPPATQRLLLAENGVGKRANLLIGQTPPEKCEESSRTPTGNHRPLRGGVRVNFLITPLTGAKVLSLRWISKKFTLKAFHTAVPRYYINTITTHTMG